MRKQAKPGVIKQRFDCSNEQFWAAHTDQNQMRQWYAAELQVLDLLSPDLLLNI